MNSVKESLQYIIERMSDEEARQMLEFAYHLQKRHGLSLTLKCLATDAGFKTPDSEEAAFHTVEPTHGKGIAASRLLVDDRR